MAHIETVHPDDADGRLRAIYDGARKRAGKVFEILRIQSLNADVLAIIAVWFLMLLRFLSVALYLAIADGGYLPITMPRWAR